MPKRPVRINSYQHNGNLFDPSKKYVCIRNASAAHYIFGGATDWDSR